MSIRNTPTFKALLKNPIQLCAFGFGSGLITPAPGTWGTLLACLLYLPAAPLFTHPAVSAIFLITTFLLGITLCNKTSAALGVHDFGGIVWDEFVGVWLVLMFMPAKMLSEYGLLVCTVVGFVLFRFFDIIKPPPIKQIDKHTPGGFGIMIDDIFAGLFALLVLYLYTFLAF